jgi:hypothetical protein
MTRHAVHPIPNRKNKRQTPAKMAREESGFTVSDDRVNSYDVQCKSSLRMKDEAFGEVIYY